MSWRRKIRSKKTLIRSQIQISPTKKIDIVQTRSRNG